MIGTFRSLSQLKRAIQAARSSGDPERLWALQTEYRQRAAVCSGERGMPVLPIAAAQRTAAQRTETARGSLAGDSDVPNLYRPYSPAHIDIGDDAWSRICAEVKQSRDGRETGGWLYANRHDPDLHVQAVTGPGDDALRQSHFLQMDLAARQDFEAELERRDSPLIRCGSWHTHVKGDSEPSGADGDLAGWSAGFEILERSADAPRDWVGLILTRGPFADWSVPAVHAYIVGRDPLTKRVRVETARTNEDLT